MEVPAATLSGDAARDGTIDDLADGNGDLCLLFGQTIPFDQATLVGLYGDADTYLARFRASAADAVAAGFMLQADADALLADVEADRARFP